MTTESDLLTSKPQRPDLSLEQAAGGLVCGLDEAGRGPIAGPVVAACVILPANGNLPNRLNGRINDSKQLTAKKRELLFDEIRDCALGYGIGEANVAEIDQINILQASLLAMRRAAQQMMDKFSIVPDLALVDGRDDPGLGISTRPVRKGDCISLSIAAASILAKVHRDRSMTLLAQEFPQFGWEHNFGYPTAEHKKAMLEHGPTIHHRHSYAPVREAARLKEEI